LERRRRLGWASGKFFSHSQKSAAKILAVFDVRATA
jgi:hypothetical protein